MPEEKDGYSIGGQPIAQPSMQPPGAPPPNQAPPFPPANHDSIKNSDATEELKNIRLGEAWLICVGIATLFINCFIAYIYMGQLGEMQKATAASTKATELASDEIEYSISQFDRAQRQTITQTIASVKSSNAAKSAADTAKQTLESGQRSWVGLDGIIKIDYFQIVPRLRVESHYDIKNFGNGPALKVVSAAWFETDGSVLRNAAIGACSAAQSFTTGKDVRPGKMSLPRPGRIGYTLFPQQPHTETIGSPSDPWQGDGIPNLRHFWFIGCVSYLDQFKAVHWSRFCVEPDYMQHPMDTNIPLKFCALYNDTDEEDEKVKGKPFARVISASQ